jgi:hypothetical protein
MRPVRLTRAQQQALTRERLLAAAERVLAGHGYGGASIRTWLIQASATACGRYTDVAAVSVQPLPSSSLGNRILTAETGGRIQERSTGERPEFGSQTGGGSLTYRNREVFVARETGSVCRDCVVELRGFEPRCSYRCSREQYRYVKRWA